MDLPEQEYLVDGIIMKRGLTYLVGPPASFKTNMMISIALAGKFKNNLLGFKINKPFKTLFIDEENGLINSKFNLVRLAKGMNVDLLTLKPEDIIFSCISLFKILPNHVEKLEAVIKKYKPDLIVIDNIARCMVGNENDASEVSKILAQLKPLMEEYGVAFVLLHHCRKGNPKTLEDIAGSRDFGGQCDNAFIVKHFRTHERIKTFSMLQTKPRFGLEMAPFNFNVEGDDDCLTLEFGGLISENVQHLYETIRTQIIAWWIENPSDEYKTSYVISKMEEQGFKKDSIRKAIKDLVKDHLISDKKYGHLQDTGIGG